MNDNKTVCDDWEIYSYNAEDCRKVSNRFHEGKLDDIFKEVHRAMLNGKYKAKIRKVDESEWAALSLRGFRLHTFSYENFYEISWS